MPNLEQETNGSMVRQRLVKEHQDPIDTNLDKKHCPKDLGNNVNKVQVEDSQSNNVEIKKEANGKNSQEYEDQFKLLLWEDMPRHLQFNPYVKTGYRPLLSAWGCIHSLFYLHNETVNILTHGK